VITRTPRSDLITVTDGSLPIEVSLTTSGKLFIDSGSSYILLTPAEALDVATAIRDLIGGGE
jgi:hypothetical protein